MIPKAVPELAQVFSAGLVFKFGGEPRQSDSAVINLPVKPLLSQGARTDQGEPPGDGGTQGPIRCIPGPSLSLT